MAPVTMRRSRVDDDDDDSLYDPEWLARGKKVVRDGGVVRTSIMLMDGVPNPRPMLNDASMHRPHQVGVVDSAERRLADAAYEERNVQLENAWRGPATPLLLALKDGQSPRDAYIERVTNAWRTPTGRNDPADDVEALQKRWASPGATPGPGRRPTQDAAPRSDANQAYEEYCARLQSAWKTR
jgi:hypothetical protein